MTYNVFGGTLNLAQLNRHTETVRFAAVVLCCSLYWQDARGTQLRLGATHEGIITFQGSVRTSLYQWYGSPMLLFAVDYL